jgi:hypothetical protein
MTIKSTGQGKDVFKGLIENLKNKNIKHIEVEKYEDFMIPGRVPVATISWGNNLKFEIETKDGQVHYIEATGPFVHYSNKLPPEQKKQSEKHWME